ncbi:MAG: glucuronate isomerase [Planctomycetota bacterium]
MAAFGENYLLESDAAAELYSRVADLPIVDAHCHVSVPRIVDNEPWNDIWEVQGETDHYVWEVMRKRGVPEEKITGDAPNREKWQALAEVAPEIAGNPVYDWLHLDLRNRFGIEEPVSADTADEIWEQTAEALQDESMKPQAVLRQMDVEAVCSTDDPADSLDSHRRAAEEIDAFKVLPTWRPDNYMCIEQDSWEPSLKSLAEKTDRDLGELSDLLEALHETHEEFDELGCRASDHGVERALTHRVPEGRAGRIYQKARGGEKLKESEVADFKSFMLHQFAAMNRDAGWVTQLHIGAVRDYRHSLYESLGADSGGDVSTLNIDMTKDLQGLLNACDGEQEMVIYCLNPGHYPSIATLTRAFPNVSMGAPWWFNDSPWGIQHQLRVTATVDVLANHAGMVSDSRKILSYDSRMEMFRRCLCNVLGQMVDRGRMPRDVAGELAEHLSYERPKDLFGL